MMRFLKMLLTELYVSDSVKKTIIMHELQEANKKANKKK